MTGETLPHNVDICITCVTDKPPQLPLREELHSLGIEVVYNAHGIGAKASRHEAKKLIKKFREAEQIKDLGKRRLFPSSPLKIRSKLRERKRIENALRIPKALSYEKYENRLNNNEGSSNSSWCSRSTNSTADLSCYSKDKEKKRKSRIENINKYKKRKGGETNSLKTTLIPLQFPISFGSSKKKKKKEYISQSSESTRSLQKKFRFPIKFASKKSRERDEDSQENSERHDSSSSEGSPPENSMASTRSSDDVSSSQTSSSNHFEPSTAVDEAFKVFVNPSLDHSASTSFDPSTLSTNFTRESPLPAPRGVEVISSPATAKFLPGLQTVSESESEQKAIQNAFSHFNSDDQIYRQFAEGKGESSQGDGNNDAELSESERGSTEVSKSSEDNWIKTAKVAFKNVAAEVYKATGLEVENTKENSQTRASHDELHLQPDGKKVFVKSSIGPTSVQKFVAMVREHNVTIDAVQRMLRVCPALINIRMIQDGRLTLHAACDRGFPDRISKHQASLSSSLVKDIVGFKALLEHLVSLNKSACTITDNAGDLPVHLLARTLMEWEAQWYEKVYQRVQTEKDIDGRNAANITKLYQSMSNCIELVLNPVASTESLCKTPGSIGRILPLHIASIFTSSVSTIRMLLEEFPDAASEQCDLGHLRTFIPDKSLPLELHDKLSTDYPKWEISAEVRKSKLSEDYMRRSDLLFAFHPDLPRFQLENARISRLEAKVQSEASDIVKGGEKKLSLAVKLVWIWMCTFTDSTKGSATYAPSVKRIVDSIPSTGVKHLAYIRTPSGKRMVEAAAVECSQILKSKLTQIEDNIAQIAVVKNSSKSSLAPSENMSSRTFVSLKGKGYVGVLCRALFNIREDLFPTSFIILPYRLTKNQHGKLTIDKKSSASTAVKFAECLLRLTDPKAILFFLEQKYISHSNTRIRVEAESSQASSEKFRELQRSLLSLYNESAYFYLIDELIGLPIVPATTSIYPITLPDPQTMVRKLMPLMMTGMILMRGEKALSVLVNLLLDKSVQHVSQNWVDTGREIIAYLYSQNYSRSNKSLPGLNDLVTELRGFVSDHSADETSSVSSTQQGNNEWNIELSILKMVLQMNDTNHVYAGLKAKRDEPGTVLWTKHSIEDDSTAEPSTVAMVKNQQQMATYSTASSQGDQEPKQVESDGAGKQDGKDSRRTDENDSAQEDSLQVTKENVEPSNAEASFADKLEKKRRDIISKPGKGVCETPLDPQDEADMGDSTDSLFVPKASLDDISSTDGEQAEPRKKSTTRPVKKSIYRNDKKPTLDESSDAEYEEAELQGVRILQEVEDGPSLLDQDTTTEDEYQSEIEPDKYRSVYEHGDGDSTKRDLQSEGYATSVHTTPAVTSSDLMRNDSLYSYDTITPAETTKLDQNEETNKTEETEETEVVKRLDSFEQIYDELDVSQAETSEKERHDEAGMSQSEKTALSEDIVVRASEDRSRESIGKSEGLSLANTKEDSEAKSTRIDIKQGSEDHKKPAEQNEYQHDRLHNPVQQSDESTIVLTGSPKFVNNLHTREESTEVDKKSMDSRDSKSRTFRQIRTQLRDQAVKLDYLESSLRNIKIREDKLLSRGEMLHEFLVDVHDQSESLKLKSENEAKKLQLRLYDLEERILCNEIEEQHLALEVFVFEDDVEDIVDRDYQRRLCDILDAQKREEAERKSLLENRMSRMALRRRIAAGKLDETSGDQQSHESDSNRAHDGQSISRDPLEASEDTRNDEQYKGAPSYANHHANPATFGVNDYFEGATYSPNDYVEGRMYLEGPIYNTNEYVEGAMYRNIDYGENAMGDVNAFAEDVPYDTKDYAEEATYGTNSGRSRDLYKSQPHQKTRSYSPAESHSVQHYRTPGVTTEDVSFADYDLNDLDRSLGMSSGTRYAEGSNYYSSEVVDLSDFDNVKVAPRLHPEETYLDENSGDFETMSMMEYLDVSSHDGGRRAGLDWVKLSSKHFVSHHVGSYL